jgi:hypothetical protein
VPILAPAASKAAIQEFTIDVCCLLLLPTFHDFLLLPFWEFELIHIYLSDLFVVPRFLLLGCEAKTHFVHFSHQASHVTRQSPHTSYFAFSVFAMPTDTEQPHFWTHYDINCTLRPLPGLLIIRCCLSLTLFVCSGTSHHAAGSILSCDVDNRFMLLMLLQLTPPPRPPPPPPTTIAALSSTSFTFPLPQNNRNRSSRLITRSFQA